MEAVSMNMGGGLTAADAHREFRIALPGVDVDAVEVESLEGLEAVNADYSFRVRISSELELDPADLMGQSATLALGLGTKARTIQGLVTTVDEVVDESSSGVERTMLSLEIHSPLFRPLNSWGHRVFRRKSAAAIAAEVLGELLDGDCAIVDECEGNAHENDMVVQGRESDLEFVQRVLSREGQFLLIRQGRDGPEVVIRDRLAGAGDTVKLKYVPQSGQNQEKAAGECTAYSVRRMNESQPEYSVVGGYDPDHPNESQSCGAGAEGGLPGMGSMHLFGLSGGGRAAHEVLAGRYQAAFDCARERVLVVTEERLAPGMSVKLVEHPNGDINGGYLVERVEHEGDQSVFIHGGDDTGRPKYRCRAWLLPESRDYAPLPRTHEMTSGLLFGEIEGENDDRAHLNEEGAYRVRLAQDESGSREADASPPVRCVQPFGGKGYGFHMPMLPKTRVAMAALHGDAQRPVILGAVSTADQSAVATADNPYEHVLRTASGHELVLNDDPDASSLRLATAEGRAELRFEATEEGADDVRLATGEGAMELACGGTMSVECGGAYRVEVEGEYGSHATEEWRFSARDDGLALEAAGDLSLASEEGDVQLEAVNGSVALSGGEELHMESGGATSLVCTEGDMTLSSEAELIFEADGEMAFVSTGDGDITLNGDSGDAVLTITGDGELLLNASVLTINADELITNCAEILDN